MSEISVERLNRESGRFDGSSLPKNADHLSYSLRRLFVDQFYSRQMLRLRSGSVVLDVGGLKHKKRGQFDIRHYDQRVVYANLQSGKQPDVQADAANLPFRSSSFDAVICAELLEHVRDPVAVLAEMHRVVRTQGIVLATVPFLYQVHGDPSDYGRYTEQYWKEHAANLGFVNLMIEQQGLFWSVIVDMLRSWASEQAKTGRLRAPLARQLASWIVGIGKRAAMSLEAKPGNATSAFCKSYTTGYGICFVKA